MINKSDYQGFNILRALYLGGANIWTYRSVIEVWVDLGDFEDLPSNLIPGFYKRITDDLPSLISHKCGLGKHGGFLERLRDGTWLGHVLEHIVIELQRLSGMPVTFGQTRGTAKRGVYKMAFQTRNEMVGRAALKVGHDFIMAAILGNKFDLLNNIKMLSEMLHTQQQRLVDTKHYHKTLIGISESKNSDLLTKSISYLLKTHKNNFALDALQSLNASNHLLNKDFDMIVSPHKMILTKGFSYVECDIAVITDVAMLDDLQDFDILEDDDLYRLLYTQLDQVKPGGFVIINAMEPLLVEIAQDSRQKIIFYALDPDLEVIKEHQADNGISFFIRNQNLIFAKGLKEKIIAPIDSLSGELKNKVDVLLAVIAVGWCLLQ